MSDAAHTVPAPRNLALRRFGAVFAGLLTVAVLDNGIDAVMHGTGVFPPFGEVMPQALFLIAVGYRMVDGMLGGYVAARLAPDRPLGHALALGTVGVVLSTLGAVALWNAGPAFGPHWYPLILVAISLPCSFVGGRLGSARR